MTTEKKLRHDVGERIKQARERKSMTQSDLADKTGFQQTVISRMERGESPLSAYDLVRLAEALELPVMYFFPEHAPIDITDEEIAFITLLRQLPKEIKDVIYDQADTALSIYKQTQQISPEAEEMLRTGIIPQDHEYLYELLAATWTPIIKGNKQEILSVLKTGGACEGQAGRITVAPPERRTRSEPFVLYEPLS